MRNVMPFIKMRFALIAAVFCCVFSGSCLAAPCGGDFNAWLAEFKSEAAAQGISQRAIASALDGLSADPHVLARDRGQHVFKQSFEQFSDRKSTRLNSSHANISY